jgi:hypothetical protein
MEMYVELVEHDTFDTLATIKYDGMCYLLRSANIDNTVLYVQGLLKEKKDGLIYVDYLGYGKLLFTALNEQGLNTKLMQYSIVR